MAQASVTGKGLTQIALSVHGTHLDPLNIEPAKDLWHQLGEALADAERNRDALVAEGSRPDDVEKADSGIEKGTGDAPGRDEAALATDAPGRDETPHITQADVPLPDVNPEPAPGDPATVEAQAARDEELAAMQARSGGDAVVELDSATKAELIEYLEAHGSEGNQSEKRVTLLRRAKKIERAG